MKRRPVIARRLMQRRQSIEFRKRAWKRNPTTARERHGVRMRVRRSETNDLAAALLFTSIARSFGKGGAR